MDQKFQCPIECPHQADEGTLAMLSALASRITLPILTCAIVGFYFSSITNKENRALNQQEATGGLVALFLSYQPTLFAEALRFAANKYLK